MSIRLRVVPIILSGTCVLLVAAFAGAQQGAVATQAARSGPETAPPADQTYIGVTKCAACHFEQFANFRKEQAGHAKAFDILPAAYKEDASCLECHTTGFGHPTGFKTVADKQLAGVTCESCHGPGSAHAEIAKPFANKKGLAPDEEKTARDSIWLMLPENVCVTCHAARAHKSHPEFKK